MIFYFDFGAFTSRSPTDIEIRSGTKTHSRRALSGKLRTVKHPYFDDITITFDRLLRTEAVNLLSRIYEQRKFNEQVRVATRETTANYPYFKGIIMIRETKLSTTLSNIADLTIEAKVVSYEEF